MRRKRQMSTLQDYEIVDLYARACADALEQEIRKLGGNVPNPEPDPDEPIEPDIPDEPIEPGEPVFIIDTDGDYMYDGVNEPYSIYGEERMEYRISGDGYGSDQVWIIRNTRNEYRSIIFSQAYDCRAYSKLRIRYQTSDRSNYENYMANILLISRFENIGTVGNEQTIEYHNIVDVSKPGQPITDTSFYMNADSEAWEWIEIDISDIDSMYLGFRSCGGTFYVNAVQLAN